MYVLGGGAGLAQGSRCVNTCVHLSPCVHRHQAPEHRISELTPTIIRSPPAPSYPFSFGKSIDSGPERSAPQSGTHSKLELKRFTDSHLRPTLWKQDLPRGCTDSQLFMGHGGNVTGSAVSMTLRWTGWWSTVSSEL